MINVSDNFHKAAFGQVINPITYLYVSFNKEIENGKFFTLNQSQLNGPDLLKFSSSDASTQGWDFYDYRDYTDRLVKVNWERSLQFPYQIQCGMGDFTVSNTDGYFTPLNSKSSIGEKNLPARPVRIIAGFNYQDNIETVPQIVGITEGMPDINQGSKTADYHMVDFLYDICNQTLKTTINMRNARTDEVIAAILQTYGLLPSQYSLERGNYTIPFVFFDIGDSVGDALKKLVQSENGYMWLDEEGVVRFATSSISAGGGEPVATLSDYHIISLSSGDLSDIVNHVRVMAEIREVQEWQEIYAKTTSERADPNSIWAIEPYSTMTISCGLSDPCYDVVAPTLGQASSVSWFTAYNEDYSQEVYYGVTATGVLSSNTYTITFTNMNSYIVRIKDLKLWGEPAKVYDVLDYDAYDDQSVKDYGDQLLEITDNQFFQTYEQADAFAKAVIRDHQDYTRAITAEVKGDFSFQLMDLIKISTSSGDYNSTYRIMGTSYGWDGRELITKLNLVDTKLQEGVFTLNVSKLNGEDLIQ